MRFQFPDELRRGLVAHIGRISLDTEGFAGSHPYTLNRDAKGRCGSDIGQDLRDGQGTAPELSIHLVSLLSD